MSRGRQFLAFVTAYALTLNTLLPGLAFGWALPDPTAAVICGPGGAGSAPDAPAQPHTCCPGGGVCAMSDCGPGVVPGRGPSAAMPAWVAVGRVPLPVVARFAAPSPRNGNLARGPRGFDRRSKPLKANASDGLRLRARAGTEPIS